MSETDVRAPELMLTTLRALLAALAEPGGAGICHDDLGIHCVYCEWADESWDAEAEHEAACPIRQARAYLDRLALAS